MVPWTIHVLEKGQHACVKDIFVEKNDMQERVERILNSHNEKMRILDFFSVHVLLK